MIEGSEQRFGDFKNKTLWPDRWLLRLYDLEKMYGDKKNLPSIEKELKTRGIKFEE